LFNRFAATTATTTTATTVDWVISNTGFIVCNKERRTNQTAAWVTYAILVVDVIIFIFCIFLMQKWFTNFFQT